MVDQGNQTKSKKKAKYGTTEGIPVEEFRNEVLTIVNKERKKAGLRSVRMSKTLCKVTKKHVVYMGSSLNSGVTSTHKGRKGETLRQRINAFGYKFDVANENVSRNQWNPKHFMKSVMKSDDHCVNVLEKRATCMGVSVIRGHNDDYYWCQIFTKPKAQ